jgi:hypothetical protein
MKRLFPILVVVVACAVGTFLALRDVREDAGPVTGTSPPQWKATTPAVEAPASAPLPARVPSPPDPPRRRPRSEAKPAVKSAPTPPPEAPSVPRVSLRVTSDVRGAQVFIDRRFVGETPINVTDITPGSHQLNVSAAGFDPHVETITVEGERNIYIAFRRVRLNIAMEVVHNHRFGSCRGRLVATPEGVRYETTDKDDAFTVRLQDLEIFQIDYLRKNLRIQPRGGRRYDFTDRDGNADRLLVFHRDVEKARDLLRKVD